MTNLGTFRAYLKNYIMNHPGINQDKLMIVRQLASGENGIPLEIYAFTGIQLEWLRRSAIDIFDHIFAVAGELRVFQSPSRV